MVRWYIGVATLLVVAVMFSALPGCGDGMQRAAVRGRVTLDGEPLEQGTVRFLGEGTSLAGMAAAEVVGGEYRLDAANGPVVGSNRVEITSYQKTGSQQEVAPGKWRDVYRQAVPERYNVESRERAEIVVGDNEFDFALESE